ncbi:DUF2950 family protein [Achromobacter insolitus]|uniref:DUF2950 family protein n=1 Tax=Achromobacter insolitus TaxID=217204 RepID=UPI00174CC6E4|nr:DUF2950 family protein [Achromobacter insolitus]
MKPTRHILSAALFLALSLPSMAVQAVQEYFDTPQKAADALVQAVATGDDDGLKQVLGQDFHQFIPQDSIDREDIYAFLAAWSKQHRVVTDGPDSADFFVGEHGWTFPAPLIKGRNGWTFDVRAGVREMRNRRIARNEEAAINTLHRLCAAQSRFIETAGTGQPARRIVSRDGHRDGLYWDGQPANGTSSPLDDDALVMGPDTPPDAALHGYRFAYLSSSDPSGCSFMAWPARHGESGLHSFVIGAGGTVRERDFNRQVREPELRQAAARDQSDWAAIPPT